MLVPRAVFRGTILGEMGLLKKLGVKGMLGLSVAECDPVRCALPWFCLLVVSVGANGRVFFGAIHLLRLYLTKRELETEGEEQVV